MPNLRELRDALLTAYNLGAIDDVEFALLYDLNTSKTPEIPYWQYDPFSLENMHKDECKAEFRIEKENLHDLVEALQLEDEQFMYNRLKVDTIEAICVLLKRLAYPCRYLHVVPRFARPVAEICVINNHMMNRCSSDSFNGCIRTTPRSFLSTSPLDSFALKRFSFLASVLTVASFFLFPKKSSILRA